MDWGAEIHDYKQALVAHVPETYREALKKWLDSLDHESLIQPKLRGPLVRNDQIMLINQSSKNLCMNTAVILARMAFQPLHEP